MKIIGIISRSQNISNKEFIGCYINYVKKVKRNNISPIIIPEDSDISILSICDGIIAPGGDNVSEFDKLVLDYVIKHNIPYLGICLGMQVMADSLIKTSNHYLNNHIVYLNKNSLLYKIYKCDRLLVNSRHKDKINKTKYNVSAFSHDDVIEGIEVKNKKFIIGVQWHPEDLSDNKLFDYFISKL